MKYEIYNSPLGLTDKELEMNVVSVSAYARPYKAVTINNMHYLSWINKEGVALW